MYVLLRNLVAVELIQENDSKFPGVPIEKRYSPEFLSRCVVAEDGEGVTTGMVYDQETGTFHEPPAPEASENGPTAPTRVSTSALDAAYQEGVNSYGD